MLTFLELCQNLSRAQIMFWCQDLSSRNLSLNLGTWRCRAVLCLWAVWSWWPIRWAQVDLSRRWILPTGAGIFHSALRQEVQHKNGSPDLVTERPFRFPSYISIRTPVPKPQLLCLSHPSYRAGYLQLQQPQEQVTAILMMVTGREMRSLW